MCEATLHYTFQSFPRLNSWAIGPGLLTSISFLARSSFFWEFPQRFWGIFQPSPVRAVRVGLILDWKKPTQKNDDIFLTDSTVGKEILISIWVTRDSDSITVDSRNLALTDWYKRSQELHHHIIDTMCSKLIYSPIKKVCVS